MSALTRESSNASLLSGIQVFKTDYSEESLVKAFEGQDVVVSTIATISLSQQEKVINAAVKAGVKRFNPSEYGMDTSRDYLEELLPFALAKQNIVKCLKTKEGSGLSWTAVFTGAWFELVCCPATLGNSEC